MRFQFRFQSLLDLRQSQRDSVMQSIAVTINSIAEVDQEIQSTLKSIDEVQNLARSHRTKSTVAYSLVDDERQNARLQNQLADQRLHRKELGDQLQRQQRELIQLEVDLKRFEVLRRNDFEAFVRIEKSKSQNADDDLASLQRTHRRLHRA